jgi:hypothetical protein
MFKILLCLNFVIIKLEIINFVLNRIRSVLEETNDIYFSENENFNFEKFDFLGGSCLFLFATYCVTVFILKLL